jgi:predicted GH43/DUF377 family glycosyl hydrolase
LWYSSFGTNLNQIGYATATNPDGKNWTKYSGNPVLSPTSGTWDWSQVIEPSVATYNGTLYMFYRGGYLQGEIGFATSTDKVNWYKDPNPCLLRGSAGSWDGYSLSFPNVTYDGNEYKMWYCGRSSPTGGMKIGLAYVDDLSDVKEEHLSPNEFILYQNYPNPFNPSTTITFGIPVNTHVVLKVFNTVGEEVAQLYKGEKEAGRYTYEFNASGLPSGIYFYQLKTTEYTTIKKMILLK